MPVPYVNPDTLGFDTAALDRAWISLVDGAERHEYGGAVALVARHGQITLHRATGWAVREPLDDRSPMAVDTIFDLASLTKVTATLPSVLRLIAEGRLGLDDPVGTVLPEFGTEGPKREVTIRRLLTHSAGLSAWRPVFLHGHGADAYLADFAATQPEHTPGGQVIYSDPSFITLGEVVHRLTGETVADSARKHIFLPLGMTDTRFTPPVGLRPRIAATEVGNAFEAAKAPGQAPVKDGGWRGYLLRGEVHDGNAWYGFDGVAGHAGLFGTALDLFRYGQMWLNGGVLDGTRILPQEIVHEATSDQIAIPGETERRGLGWRMMPEPGTPEENPDSGRGLGQRAFGHTGFTGTSLWMDPDRSLVIVLLTNRVHPTVTPAYMERRARFTQAVVDALATGAAGNA
ncbi:MAG: serine hydrolase domain-containing protein [Thermomicrobiales bacterium]